MIGEFTAAEQALLLIDIVITEAALFVWVLWRFERSKAKVKDHFSSRRQVV
jgi:hypothetical protein